MINRKGNMATTHPRLLSFFASKNPLFVLLKLLPLVVLFIWIIISNPPSILKFSIGLFSGILTWSLFEYATHRWLYHSIFKNDRFRWFIEAFHIHHHHNLQDYRVLNAGLFLIYPLSVVFWLIGYLIFGNAVYSSVFSLGVLLYYFFYENVHYFIHFKTYKSGYMKFVQSYHLYHHYRKWNKNFGNTLTLWDRIFGTYDPEYRKFKITKEIESDLITVKPEFNA